MGSSERPEKASRLLEFSSRARCALMSSVADVKLLTRNIGDLLKPGAGWQEQVSAVHRALTNPHFEWAIRDLTWSRVKTWFYGEVRRIDYDHMVALRELKATEEATRDHNQFLAQTNRLAAALAAEGASLSSEQMEALARIARRSAHVSSDHDARQGGSAGGVAGAGAAFGADK